MAHAKPNEGGCWYCFQKDDDLLFSWEFDTFVHLECIRHAAKKNPQDREAQIFLSEFSEPVEE